MKRRRIEVDLKELDQFLDEGLQAPLSERGHRKIKTALHAMAEQLMAKRSTEKTRAVVGANGSEAAAGEAAGAAKKKGKGHGRAPASAYGGAAKVAVPHPNLKHGEACPECPKGKVYVQKKPRPLLRVVGQAPLAATVYELEQLRCNACGQVYTAPAPEGVGEKKYDETAASMIALLRYGSGFPWNRLEGLEESLGIPLPASTQCEIVAETAAVLQPAHEELIRQAAQGELVHNDDTAMRVLSLNREAEREEGISPERTGVFTSGIVSVLAGRRMALFFTGRKHAGENLADVLKQREPGREPPIQMCDALSRNVPKLPEPLRTLLANCMAHGRRNFVEVTANFPEQCQFVLETLGEVYGYDEQARQQGLSPEVRLHFHQEHSGPVMEKLRVWLNAQFEEKKAEPNSGLGKAISYLLKRWDKLTLFLRKAGAPLDNNLVERALKKAILHRKNSLFYKTRNGARMGDLFMSLIHTAELCGANPFDYLTELQRHVAEMKQNPREWMPWNYRATLERIGAAVKAA